ncbi:hypothetical protein HOD75_04575 [archaeon]|jgi:uncharacterized membrane protein|nr:hypothetical protein [archaeon]MBT4242140.1 hypothetical protein [archaeon]MBT4417828.1 hypothetical protein [archaeon]
MKNKNVGYLIIGISIIIVFIILLFNNGLKEIVDQTCSHGSSCTMYDTIAIQTWLSLSTAALVFIIGLFLVFTKEPERIIIQKVKEKKKKLNLKGLDNDEKKVIKILQKENNAIFQKTLMEQMEIGKVKITRLLDKLEAKQLIERKRRGMNNIVVLNN